MDEKDFEMTCLRCSRKKTLEFFKVNKRNESGYDRICKLCRYDQTFRRQLEIEIEVHNMEKYKHVVPDYLLPVWEVESRKKFSLFGHPTATRP
jgi:hypothetical protein